MAVGVTVGDGAAVAAEGVAVAVGVGLGAAVGGAVAVGAGLGATDGVAVLRGATVGVAAGVAVAVGVEEGGTRSSPRSQAIVRRVSSASRPASPRAGGEAMRRRLVRASARAALLGLLPGVPTIVGRLTGPASSRRRDRYSSVRPPSTPSSTPST